MTLREYYNSARHIASTDPAWLRRVIEHAEHGDAYLRPIHVRICKLALRQTGQEG